MSIICRQLYARLVATICPKEWYTRDGRLPYQDNRLSILKSKKPRKMADTVCGVVNLIDLGIGGRAFVR